VAVNDLEQAAAFYRDVLGLTPSQPETADGATIVPVAIGDVEIELMRPDGPDGPVAKFIAKRGPGIHHVCYRVPSLEKALSECRNKGYRLVDEVPRAGTGQRRVAFVHPKATGGVLLELTE
jgi:methylmalonyl-CoA/ethylmalonyl-CoA epimerase